MNHYQGVREEGQRGVQYPFGSSNAQTMLPVDFGTKKQSAPHL